MRLYVDELPYSEYDCIFYNRFDDKCPFAWGRCIWESADYEYRRDVRLGCKPYPCNYLVELEGEQWEK